MASEFISRRPHNLTPPSSPEIETVASAAFLTNSRVMSVGIPAASYSGFPSEYITPVPYVSSALSATDFGQIGYSYHTAAPSTEEVLGYGEDFEPRVSCEKRFCCPVHVSAMAFK